MAYPVNALVKLLEQINERWPNRNKKNDGTGVSPTAVTADQSPLFPAVSLYGANSGTATFNFGASAFAYTPPAGFKAGVCQ